MIEQHAPAASIELDIRPGPAAAEPRPEAAEPLIALAGVRVRFGEREVLGIEHLLVRRGEVLAVLGPNGAGKSTLLQLCGFLLAPSAGRVLLDGRDVRGTPLWARRRATLLLQSPVLLERSVLGNVELGLSMRGVPRSERRRRAREWLDRFGVGGLADRAPRTLSGGEAQRVALARALAFEPEIVLLDEPFASLDQPTRESLVAESLRELRRLGATTIFVTHDRAEALTLADRLMVLVDGRVRQEGRPAQVRAHPADATVAAYVGGTILGDGPSGPEPPITGEPNRGS